VALQRLLQGSGTLSVILASVKWGRNVFFAAKPICCSMNASARLEHCLLSVIMFVMDHNT
jgi:hypothetical protein